MNHSTTVSMEPTLGMGAIARFIERHTGHKPSRSTLWRWHLSGRMSARRVGGRLFATQSAILEMLAADEQRNRGSAGSRGAAAASRLSAALETNVRREAIS